MKRRLERGQKHVRMDLPDFVAGRFDSGIELVPSVSTPCPVPRDFDQAAYGALQTKASTFANDPCWKSFASGLNAVAFRSSAVEVAHARFVASISCSVAFAPNGPRFAQEEAMFAFFFNACSALECFYYAMYSLGACLEPQQFPAQTVKDLRGVSVVSTIAAFRRGYGNAPFSMLIAEIANSDEFGGLKEHRDFLAHRGIPPRTMQLGPAVNGVIDIGSAESAHVPRNPKGAPRDWITDLSVTPAMTREPRVWLVSTINRLVAAGAAFLATQVS